jgi:hypothetical protein
VKSLVYLAPVQPELLDHIGIDAEADTWVTRDLSTEPPWAFEDLKPGPWHEEYVVIAESVGQLRQHLPLFTEEGVAKKLTVVLTSSADGYLRGPHAVERANAWRPLMRDQKPDEYSRSVSVDTWTSIHRLLIAALSISQTTGYLVLAGTRLGVTDTRGGSWAAGDTLARLDLGRHGTSGVSVVDSVDVSMGRELIPTLSKHSRGVIIPSLDFGNELPPVDCAVVSPRGFNPFPQKEYATLVPVEGTNRWRLVAPEQGPLQAFAELNEAVLHAIRDYSFVEVAPHTPENTFEYARLLSQLAVAGVPIGFPQLSAGVESLLGPKMSAAIRQYSKTASPDSRERASIYCRREAIKQFAPRRRWREFTLGAVGGAEEKISVVLATNRPQLLARVMQQLASQTLGDFEVVIGLHGLSSLEPEQERVLGQFRAPVIFEYMPAEWSLGAVLNRLSRISSGDLIAKIDDDDWYSPHHLEDLILAREYSSAALVGAPVEFTYVEALDITTRRHFPGERFTDHVAGGTMLISKSDLLQLGGWRNTPSAVDRALIDAVLASGMSVYRTHGQNYLMHRRVVNSDLTAHTWKADESVFVKNVLQQWDGFHFPSQFPSDLHPRTDFARANDYLSYFTNVM